MEHFPSSKRINLMFLTDVKEEFFFFCLGLSLGFAIVSSNLSMI